MSTEGKDWETRLFRVNRSTDNLQMTEPQPRQKQPLGNGQESRPDSPPVSETDIMLSAPAVLDRVSFEEPWKSRIEEVRQPINLPVC